VVGDPADINVLGFAWDFEPGGNVEHLSLHDVEWTDVEAVLAGEPRFFLNPPSPTRRASHAMVGYDGKVRALIVFLVATDDEGIWEPITGWESREARLVLAEPNEEGGPV
jgi:hypothetical protein